VDLTDAFLNQTSVIIAKECCEKVAPSPRAVVRFQAAEMPKDLIGGQFDFLGVLSRSKEKKPPTWDAIFVGIRLVGNSIAMARSGLP
jgi:phage terminase large subunit-like protein